MVQSSVKADPVAAGIYFALFKVASVADLKGSEEALRWAREALQDERLLTGLAQGTRDVLSSRPGS